ncbi:MAG: YihY/virulence factor BrkB family protein [Acidobacteria bacterium]|nr:YihY/virulence factor BrkB family protein [Acidobacteriota bacterium]
MTSGPVSAHRRGVALLKDAVALWSSKGAFQHAGALAFYTLSSLAPLLIILISIIGAVFGEEAARGEISARLDEWLGTEAARTVETAVRRSRVDEAGLLPTVMGIAALLFASTTVFAQMQSSLNHFWGVTARPSRSGLAVFLASRLASLGLVLVIGFLLLTSFVITMTIGTLLNFAEGWIPVPALVVTAVDTGASLLVAALLFATIFKILPDVRLEWRDMWFGAAVTAVLFVIGQSAISLYLTRTATASTYGAAGSIVMVLLWVYYSALILFFGAALTRAAIRLRGDRIVPKATAVRVRVDILEGDDDSDPVPQGMPAA